MTAEVGSADHFPYGYMTFVGNTTPSPLTNTIGRWYGRCPDAGGRQLMTSEHRTSVCGEGSEPKKTVTGSDLLKFSPYSVNILLACPESIAFDAELDIVDREPGTLGSS